MLIILDGDCFGTWPSFMSIVLDLGLFSCRLFWILIVFGVLDFADHLFDFQFLTSLGLSRSPTLMNLNGVLLNKRIWGQS